MRTSRPDVYSALGAAVLAAAALLLSLLALPSSSQPVRPAEPAALGTIDISLIITAFGPRGTAFHHSYHPQMIVVRRGDTVRLRVMNHSSASHGVEFMGYGVQTRVLAAGPTGQQVISFTADRAGVFTFRCSVPYDAETASCSPDHDTQVGYLVVLEPPR